MVANTYLDMDKKILGEIYSSSEMMDNLVKLCDEFGSRFPGTSGDKPAVDFMVDKFKDYGLGDAYSEKYVFPGWVRGPASLEVVSPIRRSIDCIALPWSPNGEVESRLVYLGDGPVEIYEKRKDEINGNVAMVTSQPPLGMDRDLHRIEKLSRSIIAGAEGFIFMNQYPAYGPQTGSVLPIIPSVSVSYEDGSFLLRALRRFKEVRVKVSTKCENRDVETWNVVADLPGTSKSAENVIVGAHYEGHDIAVGAEDSGSGACVVMEIARALSKVRRDLKRRIRFLCFSAEEIGLSGSFAYTKRHIDELKMVRFMLNLDAAGMEGEKGFEIHCWPDLEPFFNQVADETNAIMPTYQGISPYSDHWPFFLQGVPTSFMWDPYAVRKRGGRGYGHTKYDTVDKVDIRFMWEAAANSARLILRVANTDEWPVKNRSLEAVRKIIDESDYKETLALTQRLVDYLSKRKDLLPDAEAYLERSKEHP